MTPFAEAAARLGAMHGYAPMADVRRGRLFWLTRERVFVMCATCFTVHRIEAACDGEGPDGE